MKQPIGRAFGPVRSAASPMKSRRAPSRVSTLAKRHGPFAGPVASSSESFSAG